MTILYLLLVSTKLLLQFVDRLIDGAHQLARLRRGGEIVLVLGRDFQIHAWLFSVLKVDRNADLRESVEEPR